jgi:PAS domain S-box-containing protein
VQPAVGADGLEILDLVHEAVFVRDLQGRIISWNRAAEELYGCPRAQATGQPVDTLLATEYPGPLAALEKQLFAAGRWDGELVRTAANGAKLTIEARWALRRDAGGAPLHVVETGRDITARKAFEERLRYSEYRYHNLFGAMAASFWELDCSGVTVMLRALKKSGVTDFRAHFDANPAYVREMLRQSRVIDVNDETVKVFGRGNKEELLTNAEPFWTEESAPVFAEAVLQRLAGRPNYAAECKLRRIDGIMFDALLTVAFPPEAVGSDVLVVGIVDITARKKAFAELEASEQRYRYLFHYMPMSLTQLDASRVIPMFKALHQQGVTDLQAYFDEHPDFLLRVTEALVVEEVNDHNARMFGAGDPKEMHGPITRYWQARPDTIRRALAARYRGDEYFQEETQVVKFDGSTIDVLFSTARPAPVQDKSLVGFLDITALKQAHAAVEQSEVRYRNLFHHMPIPLWRTDSTDLIAFLNELRQQGVTDLMAYMRDHPDFAGRAMEKVVIAEVNESAVRVFGARDASELLGSVTKYWKAHPETYERILAARFRGDAVFGEQTQLTTVHGRALEGLFFVAFPPQLSALGVSISAFVDSTERIRAEQMLQQVQAEFAHAARVSMLGELSASIAHEVNQPLAAIATNGEAGLRWLNRAEPNIAEASTLLRRVVTDARRAADIIARVRGMASRGAETRVPVSLHQVIQEALLFLGHEIQSRAVSVMFHPAIALPDVRADRTQMQQVVVNLAVNAMQAMTHASVPRRTLAIRTTLPDPATVRCIIEDSGPGIDGEHLDRLFESFFTTKESGMGLGLPICRSIIEAHGGRVEADNASTYGGARFSFTLPTAAAGQN